MGWPFSNGANTNEEPGPSGGGGLFGLPSLAQIGEIGRQHAEHLVRTDAALARIEAAIARVEAALAPRIEARSGGAEGDDERS